MTVGRLRLKCIDCQDAGHWGLLLRDAILDINTRCIRVQGFSPAEILLGYNPVTSRVLSAGGAAEDWLKEGLNPDDVLHPIPENVPCHMTERDENRETATDRLARSQHSLERNRPAGRGYRKPRPGDMVLRRDLARDKQHGRKLDPRWTEPRVVDRLSNNGMSAYIWALHDPPSRAKRYHIDDLWIYIARKASVSTDPTISADSNGRDSTMVPATVTYSRTAMGDKPGAFVIGQRAFDLTDLVSRFGTRVRR